MNWTKLKKILIGTGALLVMTVVIYLFQSSTKISEFGKGSFFGGADIPNVLSISLETLDTPVYPGDYISLNLRVASVSSPENIGNYQVKINYPESIRQYLIFDDSNYECAFNPLVNIQDDSIAIAGFSINDNLSNHLVDGFSDYVQLCNTLNFTIADDTPINSYTLDFLNNQSNDVKIGNDIISPNNRYAGTINIIAKVPILTLSTTSIDFHNISYNTTDTKSFQIQNTGNADMHVTGLTIGNDEVFSHNFGSEAITISPGGSRNVIVTFAPNDILDFNDTLTINTQEDLTPNTVTISGSGVNDTPIIDNINLSTPDHNSDMTVNIIASDINHDNIEYRYTWTDNNTNDVFVHPETGWTSSSLDVLSDDDATFEPGDNWTMKVDIKDIHGSTTSASKVFSFGTATIVFEHPRNTQISTLDFGNIVYTPNISENMVLFIKSVGMGITVDSIYLDNTDEFALNGECNHIDADGYCNMQILFKPDEIGGFDATLSIQSIDLTNTVDLQILGNAINVAPVISNVDVSTGDLLSNVNLTVTAHDDNHQVVRYRYYYESSDKKIYHPSAESFVVSNNDILTPEEGNFKSNEVWNYTVIATDGTEETIFNGTFVINETADGQSPVIISEITKNKNYIGQDNGIPTFAVFPSYEMDIPLWVVDPDGSETISAIYTNTDMTFTELVGDTSDSISITSPLDQSFITDSTVSISGNVADTTTDSINILVKNLTGNYNQANSLTINAQTFSTDITNIDDGLYQIQLDDKGEKYNRYFYYGADAQSTTYPNLADYTHKAYDLGYKAGASATSFIQSITLSDNYNNSSNYQFKVLVPSESDYPQITSINPIATNKIEIIFNKNIAGDNREIIICNTVSDVCNTLNNSIITDNKLDVILSSSLEAGANYSVTVTGITTTGNLKIPVLPDGVTGTFQTIENPTLNRGNCDGSAWSDERGVIEFNDVLLALRYTIDKGDPAVIAKKNTIEANCNLVINNNSWNMPNNIDMNDVLAVLSLYLLEGQDGFITKLQQSDIIYISRAIQMMKEHDGFWPTSWEDIMSSDYIGYNVVNPVFPYNHYDAEFTSQSIRISARLENDELFERVIYNN